MKNLLASAPTLEKIEDAIARFYMGERKVLSEEGENSWKVCHPDGMPLLGVRVRKYRGRYRFEMVI